MTVPSKPSLPLAALLSLIPLAPALAHTGSGVAVGLQSGLLHPITGPDHLVAMVAVGLWGAQLGAPAIWVLPITFPLVMAIGGLIGLAGVPLPLVEPVVALSGLALGLLIALHVRPPLWVAAVVVGVFAIFHGYAHGRELPGAADPTAYAVGFVVATGLLHLVGILIGVMVAWPAGARLVRACGAAIGCVGLYFLLASVGVLS
ncbi:HupE/UreJ family protein [Rhodoplanes sp. TEM]|uniref:HupE/UreJ family protein n=1 Tax=Rhodoplanes tepidamans TaxID=200616 RepID=A0ABT5JGL8_RHOTP|nr:MULTISPECIES: HupE/UreJ family protein [Rhodoplanes]MDC7788860.1 HupE/UreJ family protein [Rhodoplanes tepidamans]MDC7986709.1 HupE/UreJ family protein [Rhodoplanes sp. TEM]MDQ0357837.1 urease accessory protein [Rhodoplanes tepidamans]